MGILEKAESWALENLKNEDTVAILLVGSWARGSGTDVNDIDIIVVKQFQLTAINHEEHKLGEFTLDIWIYDKEAMIDELQKDCINLNQINNTSMVLSFLPDSIIWYEKEPFISNLIEKAKSWHWNPEYENLLNIPSQPPTTSFLVTAYNENVNLLNTAKNRLHEGKPISHRRKDYPELIIDTSESKAKLVLELTEKSYASLGIDRKWTEFDDGRKAVKTGNWGVALASLKDVLRFIIRYELPTVPEQLLDPNLWKSVEDMKISDELHLALQEAYS